MEDSQTNLILVVLILGTSVTSYILFDNWRFRKRMERRYGHPPKKRRPVPSEPVSADALRIAELESNLAQMAKREAVAVASKDGLLFQRDKLIEKTQRLEADLAQLNSSTFGPERIADFEKETARLRERGKAAVEQRLQAEAERDRWEARALKAEQTKCNAEQSEETDLGTTKYQQLKRFVAREFHPDHSTGSGIEKAVRTETFKVIWAKVDQLDRI